MDRRADRAVTVLWTAQSRPDTENVITTCPCFWRRLFGGQSTMHEYHIQVKTMTFQVESSGTDGSLYRQAWSPLGGPVR